ncbi:DUF1641 domain-containing protein [Brevibacillus laterosporus]|uniref:DUF1641 domain-containing protein n=1 Tax=Brevibacillus laterosporus TaxID=1465 RepID=A0AAP3DH06_BRELA|nr:DUF1641 domain-containing protein [Brevibacillus laterosporus]MCR8979795.1 DUF1641 domain-containing protein [Brevibacillus laterosporus]MCZ0806950.1 DUF1641 domain-containing protein [Brevibacillus laterosporus]MCZ0825225.1 DUF1641 domain-containing protein [Brevibacillus laterosporus]MCZ0849958.1 DUF1641 domain-containing protein [Brevibacillus laterosporus]PPB08251.1 hypothetical protein C4A77_08705 [Brevibacillus laterosporus]
MAKPITKIAEPPVTKEEDQELHLTQLKEEIAMHAESIRQSVKLLDELHQAGVLETMQSMVQSKEKMAGIAVKQLVKPNVTKSINNVMALTEVLAQIEPEMTKKLVSSLTHGLQKAEEASAKESKIGMFDLFRALQDPDINRAISFGLHMLKGIGENLGEQEKQK